MSQQVLGVKFSSDSVQDSLRAVGLSAGEPAMLKAVFGLNRDDELRVAELASLTTGNMDALIDEFQTLLLDLPAAKALSLEEGRLEAFGRFTQAFFELTISSEPRENIVASRFAAVQELAALAVPKSWLVAAYSFFISTIAKEIASGPDPRGAIDTLVSLCKVAFLDMALMAPPVFLNDSMGQQSVLSTFEGAVEASSEEGSKTAQMIRTLSSVSSRIAEVAAQLSGSTNQALAAVSQTTATAEEVRQVSEQTTAKAKDISSEAKTVASVAKQGLAATEATIADMLKIREQMESIGECMERLNNQTKLIGEIISTVDDLAQQSNLLAVNASIEAAKAGEQGKGFGVVAQEVKKLSKQSKVATAHVRKILNDVVGAGGDAIIAAERGSRAVDAGHIQAGDTGQVIRTLTTSISRASEATELIAVSSQQQLIGMKQMVQAMDHIRLSSEQNSKFAVELEKYSRQLADVGNKLVAMDADEVELSLDEA